MVIRCTPHHIFMKSVIIYDSPDMFPNVIEYLIMIGMYVFSIGVMISVTKLYKVTKLSRMFNLGIIEECPDGIPHHLQFI